MSSQPSLPEHPLLAEAARRLEETRGAAVIHDHEYNLVWVSSEMKAALEEEDEAKIGYGKHAYEAYMTDTWGNRITEETHMHMVLEELPYVLWDTPGGKERIKEIMIAAMHGDSACPPQGLDPDEISDEALGQLVDAIEPIEPPPVRAATIEFLQGDLPPLKVTEIAFRVRDDAGNLVGTAAVYAPDLPARVLAMVARGDEEMFMRMTNLTEAGRRKAAILFADLQGSAALSRKLPSAAYFKLVRAITSAVDQVVIDNKGIVGKHAGDGVTAFFLADDLGSPSAAACAAIKTARKIGSAAGTAAKEVGDETGLIEASDCVINAGIHWGGTLYMGQLVTGGRLEVTALGDEVNECARIQQSARDGEVLASKAIIEHVSEEGAKELGFDPDLVLYRTISELPGAPEKSVKDAGGISITVL